jgi:diketogulonate reductase-like aldo/keto reductase
MLEIKGTNKNNYFAFVSLRGHRSRNNNRCSNTNILSCSSDSYRRHPFRKAWRNAVIAAVSGSWMLMFCYMVYKAPESTSTLATESVSSGLLPTPRSAIAYGTKDGGEKTAYLVRDAILNGFRHIVTSGNHQKHNESGVGIGWKMAIEEHPQKSLKRSDLFLQTMFVPWDGTDFRRLDTTQVTPTISQQVTQTVEQSLRNLQTTYIDAMLYHNFRATLHPYEDMIQAWRVLENYVQRGIIRYLGISNIHDETYFQRLYNDSIIKPSIVQNRFHSNRGFDVTLRPLFQRHHLVIQRFWVLNGNGDGVKRNLEVARQKGVTPEQLMLAFVMTMGDTPLVGTHSLQHMMEDIQISRQYRELFTTDSERAEYAKSIGIKS